MWVIYKNVQSYKVKEIILFFDCSEGLINPSHLVAQRVVSFITIEFNIQHYKDRFSKTHNTEKPTSILIKIFYNPTGSQK